MSRGNPYHPLSQKYERYEAHKRKTQARNEQGCAPLCLMVLAALVVVVLPKGTR